MRQPKSIPPKAIMATSPVHASSQRGVLKYTRVMINSALISAPPPAPLNENLLHREVYDYDFSRERVFLEIAHAEIEAMREAEAQAASAAAAAATNAEGSEHGDVGEELARQSKSLSISSSGRSLTPSRPRSPSDEDVAAAISASLREY